MFKSILISLTLILGLQAQADVNVEIGVRELAQLLSKSNETNQALNWTVGDTADYKMAGGMINGTMKMLVREETSDGFWVQQDVNLGFMGQQKIEILYDKNSGRALQVIVNGEKQTPPTGDESELVDSRQDKVTVPKGTFECIYVKMRDKKSNEMTEAWVNMEIVPVGGLLKVISPSQVGAITLELTNFFKQ